MKRFLLITLFVAASANAHDFWIEPSSFRPAQGETVTASLRVGEHFDGDPVIRTTEHLDAFIARDASGTRDVHGFEGEDPAGMLRFDAPTVLGYRSKGTSHEITSAKFMQFVREEGITGITAPKGPVRERYYRYAKALLGDAQDAALGFRYELVAEGDTFRVLFEGKPQPKALVAAIDKNGKRVSARTGRDGRATLKLGQGVWLVKSVHVLRKGEGWESLWASVTLER